MQSQLDESLTKSKNKANQSSLLSPTPVVMTLQRSTKNEGNLEFVSDAVDISAILSPHSDSFDAEWIYHSN